MAPKDKFSNQSKLYATYRPNYPDELFNTIYQQLNCFTTALDVATGNGQIASVLANKFEKVYATDISENQLTNAIKKNNIIYKKEAAENFSFADKSFDLITVAQAIHWFDIEKFYTEVKRTLKPNGIICVIGYGLLQIDEFINPILNHFYTNVIGPYWDKERKHIDTAYQSIPFPFKLIPSPQLFMEYEWTLDHFIKYLETWSGYQNFVQANNYNPIGCSMLQDLQEYWNKDETKKIKFPLFIKMGSKI